jgi:hypothetical protein
MAGTRLLIVISFLGPFIAWALISFYAGIYRKHDLLWYRIFPKPGKIALQASKKGTAFEKLTIEPLNVIADETSIPFWKDVFRDFVYDDRIQLIGTNSIEDLKAICDTDLSRSIDRAAVSNADLSLCESQTQTEKTRLVLLPNTAVLYASSSPQAHRTRMDLRTIFPKALHRGSPFSFKIVVLIDEHLDQWKETMNIASQWFQSKEFWPYYKNVELDFQVTDIANAGSQDDESRLLLLPTSRLVSEHIFGNNDNNDKRLLAAVFVTDRPCAIVDEEGKRATTAMAGIGNHIFQIASTTTTGIETALDIVSNLLFSRCLGIPENLQQNTNVVLEINGNNKNNRNIPSLYEKLWMQRTVLSYYDAVTTKALTVRQTLLQAPNSVAIPASYAQTFFEACDFIDRAREHVTTDDVAAAIGSSGSTGEYFLLAISYLEESERRLNELLEEPALAIPADFPIEQYAAIFAPLLFPLLVPLLATLIREYKRYRKLVPQTDGS